jgi:hypothetical protein
MEITFQSRMVRLRVLLIEIRAGIRVVSNSNRITAIYRRNGDGIDFFLTQPDFSLNPEQSPEWITNFRRNMNRLLSLMVTVTARQFYSREILLQYIESVRISMRTFQEYELRNRIIYLERQKIIAMRDLEDVQNRYKIVLNKVTQARKKLNAARGYKRSEIFEQANLDRALVNYNTVYTEQLQARETLDSINNDLQYNKISLEIFLSSSSSEPWPWCF